MSVFSILIIDDEQSVRESLQDWLAAYYQVDIAADGREGLALLEQKHFDLLLLDQRMPEISGLEILRRIVACHPEVAVIMMTGYGSVNQAVEAMKLGAVDYLLKPVELDALKIRIDKTLNWQNLTRENQKLKKQLDEKFSFHQIITVDPAMKKICEMVETVAHSDASVLISGESGTGKELIARAVHQSSARKNHPFVAVACGAIPDTLIESELFGHEKGSFTGVFDLRIGKFEEAGDGTILLDELGELSQAVQVKFLRILQEREFCRIGSSKKIPLKARVVSCTNKNLEEMIQINEFRQDLYYRINTVQITLPPLCHRRGDIALLARHFLQHFAKKYRKETLKQIDRESLHFLLAHSWPGNVRELKSAIEQAVVLAKGNSVLCTDLPDYLTRKNKTTIEKTFQQQLDDFGRNLILNAIEQAEGIKGKAAENLGLSQRALSHYLKKYEIT